MNELDDVTTGGFSVPVYWVLAKHCVEWPEAFGNTGVCQRTNCGVVDWTTNGHDVGEEPVAVCLVFGVLSHVFTSLLWTGVGTAWQAKHLLATPSSDPRRG